MAIAQGHTNDKRKLNAYSTKDTKRPAAISGTGRKLNSVSTNQNIFKPDAKTNVKNINKIFKTAVKTTPPIDVMAALIGKKE